LAELDLVTTCYFNSTILFLKILSFYIQKFCTLNVSQAGVRSKFSRFVFLYCTLAFSFEKTGSFGKRIW